MLSNVSDDLASGMEGDRRLLTYCYVLTKNAILGMHLAFFGWDERSTCRVLVGWHTRRRSGSSTSGLLSFSHFNCEGMISWKKSKFFFHFWSEVCGDVRFYTRPVTVENNGFARENRSHWSTVETFVMFSGKCFLVLRTVCIHYTTLLFLG